MSVRAPRTRCRCAAGALRNPSSSAMTRPSAVRARRSLVHRWGATPVSVARQSDVRAPSASRENRPISSAAKSAWDAMKPYAMAAMSRRRVASICPPVVVSHYCRRLDLHSDCRDRVEFRILGPLEVVDHGEPVPVGGRKPRALLAALLLAGGAVVSTDRLVTAVWGADPPRDAVGALRAYVSRLRAVVPERLRWRAPGYTFAVADGELDAAEFRRFAALARER